MNTITIVSFVGVGVVAIVLVLGLVNLMRAGPPNLSQKLMRARVILQFLAVIVLMTVFYLLQPR